MNRADKIADPSMEDILASIRKIISDEDAAGPTAPATDAVRERNLADHPNAPTPGHRVEDDVFELTDELIFAGAAIEKEPPKGSPHYDLHDTKQGVHHPFNPAFGSEINRTAQPGAASLSKSFSSKYSNSGVGLQSPVTRDTSKAGRSALQPPPATGSGPSPTPSRPAWSRRDLPKTATAVTADAAEGSGDIEPEAAAIAKSGNGAVLRAWSEDIQMPVPEQGPASLMHEPEGVNGRGEPAAWKTGSPLDEAPGGAQYGAAPNSQLEGASEAAADLVQSAMRSLGDDELSVAKRVDFDRIGDEETASVAERLADALTSARENGMAPPFLFKASHEARFGTAKSDNRAAVADERPFLTSRDAPLREREDKDSAAQDDSPFTAAFANPPALKDPAVPTPEPVFQALRSEVTQASSAHKDANRATIATTVPPGGRTLEDSVREMLRPMLVQWLNDNMPRILENAIRDEIAVRGLLSGVDMSAAKN